MAFHRHHRDDGTFDGTIVSGAPFRDATLGEPAGGEAGLVDDNNDDDDEHRNNEHLVMLTRVPTRFGADVVVAELASCGIKAGVVGRQVVVFEKDLATARAIIAQTDDSEAGEDQPDTDDEPTTDSGQQ